MVSTESGGRLERTGEALVWRRNGGSEAIENVVRCFPETSPDRWISLRRTDGTEIVLLSSLYDLDEPGRQILEPVLREKYYIPVILRIENIEGTAAGKRLHVETEDGPDQLEISGEADVDFRSYPRITITDRVERRKYVIEDAAELDRHSRDLIRRHIRTPGRGRRGRSFR